MVIALSALRIEQSHAARLKIEILQPDEFCIPHTSKPKVQFPFEQDQVPNASTQKLVP